MAPMMLDSPSLSPSTSQSGTTLPLPDASSQTIHLTHPTPSEILHQSRQNGSSWRGALPIEAYLRREAYLARQTLTSNSGITYWVLVHDSQEIASSDGNDSAAAAQGGESKVLTRLATPDRRVLAGCETVRKRAFMARWSREHGPVVEETICHGVGSVFTPESFRGRGYGARMMRELGEQLKGHQMEGGKDCGFSVLFSDVGKKFYAKHGWHPYSSKHIHLSPLKKLASGSVRGSEYGRSQPLAPTEPIFDKDLSRYCKHDEALVREKMISRVEQRKDPHRSLVALIPDHNTIEWHHAREKFVSNELYGQSPTLRGATAYIRSSTTGSSNQSGRVWAIWTRMWYNEDKNASEGNTMHILRLGFENADLEGEGGDKKEADVINAIAAVMQIARKEAAEWRMGEVELWNPSAVTVKAAKLLEPDVEIQEREEESICSLKWYGEEGRDLEWYENEKFGWC